MASVIIHALYKSTLNTVTIGTMGRNHCLLLLCLISIILLFIYGNKQMRSDVGIKRQRILLKNTRSGKFCHLHNFTAVTVQQKDIFCVPAKTEPEVRICIHSINHDERVSRSIYMEGSWEKNITLAIMKELDENPRAGFIDIGANIGNAEFTEFTSLMQNLV